MNSIFIYAPALFFVFLLIAEWISPDFMPGVTSSEFGVVESLQACLLLFLLIVAGQVLIRVRLHSRWLTAWVFAGMLAFLYVFLEEISYGQHYFNWNAPEYWQTLNDQNETNLHNTSSWLDQKPRLLMEASIILGGIIVPVLRRFYPKTIPQKLNPILPDNALFVTALLAILPRFYERIIGIADLNHWQLFARTSEVQELYFYYFALLYFLSLHKRFYFFFRPQTFSFSGVLQSQKRQSQT